MPNPIGLTMPFARTTSSLGYLAFSTKDVEATSYNLKSLLLTNWGERPAHYYLGCNLIEFLFAQASQETHDRIVQRIDSQVASWLPYVNIDKMSVSYEEPEGQRIQIRINFSLKGRQDLNSVLEVVVQPPAGA